MDVLLTEVYVSLRLKNISPYVAKIQTRR